MVEAEDKENKEIIINFALSIKEMENVTHLVVTNVDINIQTKDNQFREVEGILNKIISNNNRISKKNKNNHHIIKLLTILDNLKEEVIKYLLDVVEIL